MSKNEGRGLFAIRYIKKGELLIVEKALAQVSEKDILMKPQPKNDPIYASRIDFTKKCVNLLEFKGVEALRIGHLYDGTPQKEDEKVPDLSIFIENKYKNHEMPDVSMKQLIKIISLNGFGDPG